MAGQAGIISQQPRETGCSAQPPSSQDNPSSQTSLKLESGCEQLSRELLWALGRQTPSSLGLGCGDEVFPWSSLCRDGSLGVCP